MWKLRYILRSWSGDLFTVTFYNCFLFYNKKQILPPGVERVRLSQVMCVCVYSLWEQRRDWLMPSCAPNTEVQLLLQKGLHLSLLNGFVSCCRSLKASATRRAHTAPCWRVCRDRTNTSHVLRRSWTLRSITRVSLAQPLRGSFWRCLSFD